MLAPKFDTALVHRLADQLEAVLVFADRLTGLQLPLRSMTEGLNSDEILDQLDAVRDFVETARSLELALIAKIELSRQHAERLGRHDRGLKSLAALFTSSTRPLSDAAIAVGDRTMEVFHQADQVLPYLKARRVVPSSLASLDDLSALEITPDFHLCALVRLGNLAELSDSMLQLLDLNYGLYEVENDEPALVAAVTEDCEASTEIEPTAAYIADAAPELGGNIDANDEVAAIELPLVATELADVVGNVVENEPAVALQSVETTTAAEREIEPEINMQHVDVEHEASVFSPHSQMLRDRIDETVIGATDAVSDTLAIVEQELLDPSDDTTGLSLEAAPGSDAASTEAAGELAVEPMISLPEQHDAVRLEDELPPPVVKSENITPGADQANDEAAEATISAGAVAIGVEELPQLRSTDAPIAQAQSESMDVPGLTTEHESHHVSEVRLDDHDHGHDEHGAHAGSLLSRLTVGSDDPFAPDENSDDGSDDDGSADDTETDADAFGADDKAGPTLADASVDHAAKAGDANVETAELAIGDIAADDDPEPRSQGGGKAASLTLTNPHAEQKTASGKSRKRKSGKRDR